MLTDLCLFNNINKDISFTNRSPYFCLHGNDNNLEITFSAVCTAHLLMHFLILLQGFKKENCVCAALKMPISLYSVLCCGRVQPGSYLY